MHTHKHVPIQRSIIILNTWFTILLCREGQVVPARTDGWCDLWLHLKCVGAEARCDLRGSTLTMQPLGWSVLSLRQFQFGTLASGGDQQACRTVSWEEMAKWIVPRSWVASQSCVMLGYLRRNKYENQILSPLVLSAFPLRVSSLLFVSLLLRRS